MSYDLSKIEFKGEKKFLSNMYPCQIKFEENEFTEKYKDLFPPDNYLYQSSEHLYQALKSKDPRWHEYIRNIDRPEKTKTESRKMLSKEPSLFEGDLTFTIREDWDEVKLKAMEMILFLKFSQNPELLKKLKSIESPIEERNCWGDTFWGTVDGNGYNHLGRLLEKVKEKL